MIVSFGWESNLGSYGDVFMYKEYVNGHPRFVISLNSPGELREWMKFKEFKELKEYHQRCLQPRSAQLTEEELVMLILETCGEYK